MPAKHVDWRAFIFCRGGPGENPRLNDAVGQGTNI